MEASRFQLAESAKRVDARRRELMRQSEHQLVRVQALEKELDRQLGISDEQRRRVSERTRRLSCYDTHSWTAWPTYLYMMQHRSIVRR